MTLPRKGNFKTYWPSQGTCSAFAMTLRHPLSKQVNVFGASAFQTLPIWEKLFTFCLATAGPRQSAFCLLQAYRGTQLACWPVVYSYCLFWGRGSSYDSSGQLQKLPSVKLVIASWFFNLFFFFQKEGSCPLPGFLDALYRGCQGEVVNRLWMPLSPKQENLLRHLLHTVSCYDVEWWQLELYGGQIYNTLFLKYK